MRPNDLVQVFSDKYLENISDAFRTLYTEEQLSDVTIHCKEGSVKAHKLILAASSPYFFKIFRENRNDYPIIILHGITLNQLENFMDLLYRGIVDVPTSNLQAISSLVKEFEIKGIVFGERESNNVRIELSQNAQTVSPESAHNRDTRFKGQKRVAVDFVYEKERSRSRAASTSSSQSSEGRLPKRINPGDLPPAPPISVKREISSPIPCSESSVLSARDNITIPEPKPIFEHVPKLNAWARKQRKFKCNLCPSSFKRSSHLTRHQLVHTGERPFSCNQCDKAFSRHDKLKHHVRKAHEIIPDSMYESIDVDEINGDSDTESSGRYYSSPLQNGAVNEPSTSNAEFAATPSSSNYQRENSPLFTISHITSILEDSFVTPPKKGRGRPRKYPPEDEEIQKWVSDVHPSCEDGMVPFQANPVQSNRDQESSESVVLLEDEEIQKWVSNVHPRCEEGMVSSQAYPAQRNRDQESSESVVLLEDEEIRKWVSNVHPSCEQGMVSFQANPAQRNRDQESSESVVLLEDEEIQKWVSNVQPSYEEGMVCTKKKRQNELLGEHKRVSTPGKLRSISKTIPGKLRSISKTICKNVRGMVSFQANPAQRNRDRELVVLLDDEAVQKWVSNSHPSCEEGMVSFQANPAQRNKDQESSESVVLLEDEEIQKCFSNVHPSYEEGTVCTKKKRKNEFDHILGESERVSTPGKLRSISKTIPGKLRSISKTIVKNVEVPFSTSQEADNPRIERKQRKRKRYVYSTKRPKKYNCNTPSQEADKSRIERQRPKRKCTIYSTKRRRNNIGNTLSQVADKPRIERNRSRRKRHVYSTKRKYNSKTQVANSSESFLKMSRDRRGNPRYIHEMDSSGTLGSQCMEYLTLKDLQCAPPQLIKRGRGRPRLNQGVYPSLRPGAQNYDITNLPYGDLNYLTGQTNSTPSSSVEEDPVILEPLVEISTEQTETSKGIDNINRESIEGGSSFMEQAIIEPVIEFGTREEKSERFKSYSEVNISEIETKIGLIGECTISVAN